MDFDGGKALDSVASRFDTHLSLRHNSGPAVIESLPASVEFGRRSGLARLRKKITSIGTRYTTSPLLSNNFLLIQLHAAPITRIVTAAINW